MKSFKNIRHILILVLYKWPSDLYTIDWAKGEPSKGNNCATLRKETKTSTPTLSSANCDMRTRYLCSFSNDDTCGVQTSCIRSSSDQKTWSDAMTSCNLTRLLSTNKRDSDLSDVTKLGPGSYWVGLRRDTRWNWLTGMCVENHS